MRNKLCKIATARLMFAMSLIISSCWLDGNVGSCSNPFTAELPDYEPPNLAPCIDGTVEIGNQVWQKCNLNVDPGKGNSSCYEDKAANCKIYGRLYDWSTAMALPSSCNSTSCASQINAKHRGLCPSGWHIPSDADWSELISYVESEKRCTDCAGKYLKVKGWNRSDKEEALDSYGFSALPGGEGISLVINTFYNGGEYGYWWSTKENDAANVYDLQMEYIYNSVYREKTGRRKSNLVSVRCMQD